MMKHKIENVSTNIIRFTAACHSAESLLYVYEHHSLGSPVEIRFESPRKLFELHTYFFTLNQFQMTSINTTVFLRAYSSFQKSLLVSTDT